METAVVLRVLRRGLHLVPTSLPTFEEVRVQPTTGALLRLMEAVAIRTAALGAPTETILLVALGTRLTGGRRTSSSELCTTCLRGFVLESPARSVFAAVLPAALTTIYPPRLMFCLKPVTPCVYERNLVLNL